MPHLPQGWRKKAMAFLLFQIAYFVPVFSFLTLFQFTDKYTLVHCKCTRG